MAGAWAQTPPLRLRLEDFTLDRPQDLRSGREISDVASSLG